jgi:hypothetical protein
MDEKLCKKAKLDHTNNDTVSSTNLTAANEDCLMKNAANQSSIAKNELSEMENERINALFSDEDDSMQCSICERINFLSQDSCKTDKSTSPAVLFRVSEMHLKTENAERKNDISGVVFDQQDMTTRSFACDDAKYEPSKYSSSSFSSSSSSCDLSSEIESLKLEISTFEKVDVKRANTLIEMQSKLIALMSQMIVRKTPF